MKKKEVKLNRIERAILALADYLQDPMHDQYKVRQHILEILELEEINTYPHVK